ncbi:hypothetical protein Droror1_Dr00025570 [Drosera rotundifolia]
MNLFGVLKYKKMGEDLVVESGIPYTIIRPGRLTDGPYTSYDLNTLLKATSGKCRAVVICQGAYFSFTLQIVLVSKPICLVLPWNHHGRTPSNHQNSTNHTKKLRERKEPKRERKSLLYYASSALCYNVFHYL